MTPSNSKIMRVVANMKSALEGPSKFIISLPLMFKHQVKVFTSRGQAGSSPVISIKTSCSPTGIAGPSIYLESCAGSLACFSIVVTVHPRVPHADVTDLESPGCVGATMTAGFYPRLQNDRVKL